VSDTSKARPRSSREEQQASGELRRVWLGLAELELIRERFDDPSREWRRLFSELLGTFFLVLVGAGAAVVDAVSHGEISRGVAVTAPGLMVLAIILAIGAIGGAHLNPAVSLSFALRGDFPWRRVPGYVLMQVLGATLACLFLWAMFGKVGMLGATEPGADTSAAHAMLMEMILTVGLVSVILGTASAAQNLGPISAIGVAAYIVLAGLWSSPISGASMNPARSFGPDLVLANFSNYWVYVVGPILGGAIAVGLAWVLRGPGDIGGAKAAQGELGTLEVTRGDKDS
jgi:aquaporin Z